MSHPGAHWEGRESDDEEDDLPQMDGTCDACEPDEAQPAASVCLTCRFAFCQPHADKHTGSTRHPLLPYYPEKPAPALGPARELRDDLRQRGEGEGVGGDGGAGGAAAADGGQDGEQEVGKRDTVTVERLRCVEHGQEGSLYCRGDEKIICVVCAVQGGHRQHDIITLREAYLWQKTKEGIDLLASTQEMAERIKTKWTSPDISPAELELYVNQQFDALHALVRREERRTLHLVDLKEAVLTAQAAESMAEISVHTERLQEEMAHIAQQLEQLDRAQGPGPGPLGQHLNAPLRLPAGPAAAGAGPRLGPRYAPDEEARPRHLQHRRDPHDPRDHGEGGSGSSMGHGP